MLLGHLSLLSLWTIGTLALPPTAQRLRDAHAEIQFSPLTGRSQFTIPTFSNRLSQAFHVNSSALPLITFPLQDSWAGRLPIDPNPGETKDLFFWYWPSSAPGGSKTLTIWLNGGPGCSSLEGFLEENGPIRFEPGTPRPVLNPYAWTSVSDMLYIEQPVGTGYTTGMPNITNESQLADQFYGFLQQFFTVFSELKTKQLYIAGESYAGMYIPYIATRIVDASAAEKALLPLSLQGLLINDGVYSSFIVSEEAPTARFAAEYQSTLGLSTSQVQLLANLSLACGYSSLLSSATYPARGPIPLPNGNKDIVFPGCDVFDIFYNMAVGANPCFNIYRITDQCPTPADPIESYFSREDVQLQLHVPLSGTWNECTPTPVFSTPTGSDASAYSSLLFPHLISLLPRGVTLWHGKRDSILFSLGDRVMIQNLTWGGVQGFQQEPSRPVVWEGKVWGVGGEERGLRYLEVEHAGHMIPQDQPGLALHVFSSLLGLATLF
ncbi:alpha/beta-hydrolase [Dacryopinax primogenitus]|uniref:Carboxypeptidase n=1 Tax=Dacryopinax primogenitus (strain DJM 731) TaxID=1858805 RepID=M5G5N4_DACPD|nr:alpha/beta-hydrolase [Dacryopinax primogenitus]EJU01112.1 alpha/beta-hydrolase [Dacryopinax primogenitus]